MYDVKYWRTTHRVGRSQELSKHQEAGVHFRDAAFVFLDNNRVEKHSEEEDRYIVIGKVDDILFVVYTERIGSVRIISARKATPSERELYYGKNS